MKLPQCSFSHSQITSPKSESSTTGNYLPISQRKPLIANTTCMKTKACDPFEKESHPAGLYDDQLSALWLRFSLVWLCSSLFLYPLHPAFPTDVFPIKWNGFPSFHVQNTVKDTAYTWSLHERFLLMAFYKSVQNSAVRHLSISVFKSVTLLVPPIDYPRYHGGLLPVTRFTKE